MKNHRIKIIRGRIFNPLSFSNVKYYSDGALIYDDTGYIIFIGDYKDIPAEFKQNEMRHYPNSFILPGFIDCHTHIPQFDAIGLASDELLPWLEKYIFPLESKFSEKNYYISITDKFFDEVKSYGTTTLCAFSSSHYEATDYAFKSAQKSGIRAYIGKTMMDIGIPQELVANTDKNIDETIKLIEKWHGKSNGLLNYILSPRYAGSCSFDLMQKTSEIAKKYNLAIQTHLAENRNELKFIKQLFPKFNSYLQIYKEGGFLECNTLFAHCIYLDEHEIEQLTTSNCNIIHCPTSNIFLQSGFMPFFKYHSRNINICLGTDIAGGYSISILNEAKSSIETTKIIKIQSDEKRILTPINALYLSTLAGAKTLKIENITGNFQSGKYADFVIITPNYEINYDLSQEQILSKIIYCCSTQKVDATFVRGVKVWEKNSSTLSE